MTPRRVATFRLDDDLIQGLQDVYERDGVQPAEQVRRAVRRALEEKGVIKAERKQAATRKRS